MNHTVRSLVFVVESSIRTVREYAAELDRMPPGDRRIPAVLKAVTNEADVLSSALTRMSTHVEKLTTEPKQPACNPEAGKDLLEHAEKLRCAIANGFCDHCSGVIRK